MRRKKCAHYINVISERLLLVLSGLYLSKGRIFGEIFMKEHRRDPRAEEYADVSIKIQSAPEARGLEGKVFRSYSEDVSLCGMRLDVDMPVPIGALLELDIVLHNSPKKYHHLGNVVWADVVDDDNLEYSIEFGENKGWDTYKIKEVFGD